MFRETEIKQYHEEPVKISTAGLDEETIDFINGLNLTRRVTLEGKITHLANTPDGRREVELATINNAKGIGYEINNPEGGKFIRFTPVPNLPMTEITRGHQDRLKTTWESWEKSPQIHRNDSTNLVR